MNVGVRPLFANSPRSLQVACEDHHVNLSYPTTLLTELCVQLGRGVKPDWEAVGSSEDKRP